MTRKRSWRRFQRNRAIHHKAMILRDYWQMNGDDFWTPRRYGELSKGKVHCSCWMCRRKSYDDPRIMDKRRTISQMQEQLEYVSGKMEVQTNGSLCSPEQADEEVSEGVSHPKTEHLGYNSARDEDCKQPESV